MYTLSKQLSDCQFNLDLRKALLAECLLTLVCSVHIKWYLLHTKLPSSIQLCCFNQLTPLDTCTYTVSFTLFFIPLLSRSDYFSENNFQSIFVSDRTTNMQFSKMQSKFYVSLPHQNVPILFTQSLQAKH